MKLPNTPVSQTVTIKRPTQPGYKEGTQEWQDAGEETVATISNAVILPKSGSQIVGTVETRYESDYTMYAGVDDINPKGTALKRGDIVEDSMGREFTLVFPGEYGIVYEVSLKEVVP